MGICNSNTADTDLTEKGTDKTMKTAHQTQQHENTQLVKRQPKLKQSAPNKIKDTNKSDALPKEPKSSQPPIKQPIKRPIQRPSERPIPKEYNDKDVVTAFTTIFMRNNLSNAILADVVIDMIYTYYFQYKWDKHSNQDKRMNVTNDRMIATLHPNTWIDKLTFSNIFLHDWIELDGEYSFKFKFHGNIVGANNEIAIGFVSKQYNIGNKYGIGSDDKGWSWYVYNTNMSSIYFITFADALRFGLTDKDEFSFNITIKNGICQFRVIKDNEYYHPYVHFENIKAPIKIGASINSKTKPIGIEIIEQQRSFQCKIK